MAEPQFVFGYASLVRDLAGGHPATLAGARRVWGVAMDNREEIAGYKRYLDPATGGPPPLYIAFLDVADHADAAVNGFCAPVDAAALDELDRRERNYVRVEVTGRLAEPRGRTWMYRGSEAGRERLRRGVAAAAVVVAAGYLRTVEVGFAALGPDQLARFRDSTGPLPGPLRELDRVEVP